jgi:biotin synthase
MTNIADNHWNRQSDKEESPHFVRASLAAAMTLGLKTGIFHRGAKLHCINLLLTYSEGCPAKCAYCGLSGQQSQNYREKSFIRVQWPTYSLEEIVAGIEKNRDKVKRICIAMVARQRSVKDAAAICGALRSHFEIPVSLLVSPTVLTRRDLMEFSGAGADKIGVAVDLAQKRLFDGFRGSGVNGPHSWRRYWNCLEESLVIFGKGNAGAHFMVGMGESEKEMCESMQRVRDMEGRTHLFSFYPEAGSMMEHLSPPPMDQYRRIQLARFLVDERIGCESLFAYDGKGRIRDYGISANALDEVIDSGEPFRTSGCQGSDGQVACNRPFANSRPGPYMRNYPFPPTPEDIKRNRRQMKL